MEGPPVGVVMNEEDQNDLMDLPPGFRFHPTDEEIIKFYLVKKVINSCFTAKAIGEVDLNKCEPWDLPKKAKMGEKEFFFFCQRDRKYPTGMRTNRATEAGYWKATGKDKEIYKEKNCLIGMKKTLVFYRGRAPKGEKTNWVTHEYRLEGKFSYYNFPKAAKEEWVVCRIFHKNSGIKRPISGLMRMNSFVDDLMDSPSLPPLMEIPYKDKPRPSSSYIDSEDEFKGTTSATATASASSARNSDDNYLSYLSTGMNIYQSQDLNSPFMAPNNYTLNNPYEASTSNSSIYSQMGIPNPPNFSYQPSVNLIGYQYPNYQGTIFKGNRAANCGTFDDRQCKLEQFSSNHSVVSLSQDTGLSTDRTTEISSVVSKQETLSNRSFDGLEGPSIGPISDFDSLWNI